MIHARGSRMELQCGWRRCSLPPTLGPTKKMPAVRSQHGARMPGAHMSCMGSEMKGLQVKREGGARTARKQHHTGGTY